MQMGDKKYLFVTRNSYGDGYMRQFDTRVELQKIIKEFDSKKKRFSGYHIYKYGFPIRLGKGGKADKLDAFAALGRIKK